MEKIPQLSSIRNKMGSTTRIILALIVLHLLVGFGWLVYTLTPRKKDREDDSEAGTSKD